jgi:hypothetical protein
LFGLVRGKLIRYTFEIFFDLRVVNVTDVYEVTIGLEGQKMNSIVSIGYYIISCADCV